MSLKDSFDNIIYRIDTDGISTDNTLMNYCEKLDIKFSKFMNYITTIKDEVNKWQIVKYHDLKLKLEKFIEKDINTVVSRNNNHKMNSDKDIVEANRMIKQIRKNNPTCGEECISYKELPIMKNRNKRKHIQTCKICQNEQCYAEKFKDEIQKCENIIKQINLIYNNKEKELRKITREMCKYISDNFLVRDIELSEDNIKNINFKIKDHNTTLSLTDVYESIVMLDRKESFEEKASNH